MPFTPSHAVVAFAFRGSVLPASAVAIGAMAPDLPLFLPFLPSYTVTHDWVQLPFTLVLAAAIWGIWCFAVAPAASDLSPVWLAKRFPERPEAPVKLVTAVCGTVAALTIGILTHIGWDSFTHVNRWGTNHLSILRERIGSQPIYSVLQELSSVIGLAVIGVWLLARTRRSLDERQRNRTRTLRVVTLIAASVACAAGVVIGLVVGGPLWRVLYTTATIGGVLIGSVIAAGVAGWWLLTARTRRKLPVMP